MASATKQALLAALSAAQGECISGQQLAQRLGVSRAAVHKAAAALAAQGYALEAAPRRGYRLAGGDPFCAEAVGEYDAPIYLYDKLESSNRTAKTLALEGTPHGTMVLTSQQTAGRGHRPGAAGSLPGLRLSGRVPRPVLCAGPLGHGLHRDGELRRKGGGHRRRRAAHRTAGRGPHRGALPRRSEYKAVAAGGKIIRII